MKSMSESELFTLIEQYSLNEVRPTYRPLHDATTIGFGIGREQPTPDPLENMPLVGQILAVAPVIEEFTFMKVVDLLKQGSVVPMDHSACSKFTKIFEGDNRYCEYQLETVETDATSTSLRMVRKADLP